MILMVRYDSNTGIIPHTTTPQYTITHHDTPRHHNKPHHTTQRNTAQYNGHTTEIQRNPRNANLFQSLRRLDGRCPEALRPPPSEDTKKIFCFVFVVVKKKNKKKRFFGCNTHKRRELLI